MYVFSAATTFFVSLQDFCPPFANVERIMKRTKPSSKDVKVSLESKQYIQELASGFTRFILWKANQICLEEGAEEREKAAINKRESRDRKTLNGDDILHAMSTLGFDDYGETLKEYLRKYREMELRTKTEE